jgi:non-ribosomal peptide synthetase component E (peptide arylation enzyme)
VHKVARKPAVLSSPLLRGRRQPQGLPPYKVPWRIVFLPALPRNPSGKVVKTELA